MKKLLGFCMAIISAGLLSCSTASPETIVLKYTVPTLGADSVTCATINSPTPVRAVSLWAMKGAAPASNDSLITRNTKLFTPGSQDSFNLSKPTAGTMKVYVKAENNAGGKCASNVVTVVFDGIPPAKVTDFGL